MNYVGSIISNFKDFYQEINSATLNGSIDVVIVRQSDGTFASSPFHVRFGKIGVLRAREKLVDIEVNGISVPLHMKLGEAGEAFFVEELTTTDVDLPPHMATSPIMDPSQMIEEGIRDLQEHPELWNQSPLPQGDTSDDSPVPSTSTTDTPATVTDVTTTTKEDVNLANICINLKLDKKNVKRRKRRKAKQLAATIAASARLTSDLNSGDETLTTTTTPPMSSEDMFPMEISDTESVQTLNSSRTSSDATDIPMLPSSLPTSPSLMMPSSSTSVDKHTSVGSEWSGNQFASGCHPFSDGDITPITSPIGSRPPTPKSDTEFEIGECSMNRRKTSDPTPPNTPRIEIPRTTNTSRPSSLIDNLDTEWKWGELPMPPVATTSNSSPMNSKSSSAVSSAVCSSDEGKVEKTSGGLFNFMRKTKKMRHQPAQEGIYLDDLNLDQMDPEVAALYLYPSKRISKSVRSEADVEVENIIVNNITDIGITDSNITDSNITDSNIITDNIITDGSTKDEPLDDVEDAESGTGESLPRSPEPISQCSSDFEINCNNFKLPFGESIAMSLCGGHLDADHYVKDEIFSQHLVTSDDFSARPSLLFDNNLVVKINDKYYNWQVAGPQLMAMFAFKSELPQNSVTELKKKYMPKKERRRVWWSWSRSGVEVKQTDTTKETDSKDVISESSELKSSEIQSNGETSNKDDTDDSDVAIPDQKFYSKEFKKSLKLNSDQIISLCLKPGMNEVQYSVTTQYQGTTRCKSYIYLWNWDDRIIVSDIDGTITRSDVLGHVLPMIGKDWSQDGIARLYTQAADNGYKFLYLSARAIGQAKITRDYLSSVIQNGEMVLPIGPMLLSPSSLLSAFHKEVIERKPEEFKIGCLRDIKALFPSSRNPFYAGFGNKINDVWAYSAVKIPISRIFTVNYKGELRQETSSTLNSTYSKLCDIVDHVFPPLVKRKRGDSEEGLESSELFPNSDKFSSFTYWREPVQIIDDLVLLSRIST